MLAAADVLGGGRGPLAKKQGGTAGSWSHYVLYYHIHHSLSRIVVVPLCTTTVTGKMQRTCYSLLLLN